MRQQDRRGLWLFRQYPEWQRGTEMSKPLTVCWGCQSLTFGLEASVTCDKVTLYAISNRYYYTGTFSLSWTLALGRRTKIRGPL